MYFFCYFVIKLIRKIHAKLCSEHKLSHNFSNLPILAIFHIISIILLYSKVNIEIQVRMLTVHRSNAAGTQVHRKDYLDKYTN